MSESDFDLGNALEEDAPQVTDLSGEIEKATADDLPGLITKIGSILSEAERQIHINDLSKRLRIARRAIKRDVDNARGLRGKRSLDGDSRLALFPGLIDLALGKDGKVVYLVKDSKTVKCCSVYEIEGKVFHPPDKENLPFLIPLADKIMQNGHCDDPDLFDEVISFLKRFSMLEEKQYLIVAYYIFLTYLQDHQDIVYLPIILFYAVPERGKSRTGRAMTYLSYRGVHVVDLRESNLFRYSGNLGASLFLDVMDIWRKAERSMSEDILLMRYEKGATVARVIFPERGAFKDTIHYPIFGPSVIATNESVQKILGTRCITIVTPNAPGQYENPTPALALPLKERLISWRARHMDVPLPDVDPIDGITGRLWDITRPLLQVCKVVSPANYGRLVDAFMEISGQRMEDKRTSMEGLVIAAIDALSPAEDLAYWEIPLSDVLDKFNASISEDWKKTSQWLGRKMKALGIATSHSTGRSIITLNRESLDKLFYQYGFTDSTMKEVSRNAENADDDVPF